MNDHRLRIATAALSTVPEVYRTVTAEAIAVVENGHAIERGMHIGWTWSEDPARGPYLAFLSEHRMCGMAADCFFADGSAEHIPVPASGRVIDPDPEVDAERERAFYERNRVAYERLRRCGLLPPTGMNAGSQDVNEFLASGGMADTSR